MQAVYISNGVGLHRYLAADGVQESMITRRGREIITLSGEARRWKIEKRVLTFTFGKLRVEKLRTLAPALTGRVTLEYDDSIYGHVTKQFDASGLSDTISKVSGGNTWITGISVTFEEV